jgi:hypothetical protein
MTLSLQMISLYEKRLNKDHNLKKHMVAYAINEQKPLEKQKNILYNNRQKRTKFKNCKLN